MIGNYFWGGAAAPYEIEQSLRFDGSSGYLSRTHSNNNASSDFTLSMWFKKAYNGENNMMLLHTNTDPRYSYVTFGESSGDADLLIARGTSSGYAFNTSRKYRDNSAWYHLVLSVDVGTITKAYINGVLDKNTGPTGGWYLNGSDAQAIGRQAGVANNYFDGYMAEVHFIDGQALDADSFGEFDDNGVWRPIEYTGTYGDNGYYLKFDPSATNGVGHDHSGNGNNWTASGFTTSGTGTDVMSDTPTTNYATLNPIGGNASSYSEGNLKFVGDTANVSARGAISSIPVSSGKWYWEVTLNTATGSTLVGVVDSLALASTSNQSIDLYYLDNSYGYASYDGNKREGTGSGASNDSYGNSYTSNDIIGVALDLDNEALYFSKNGTWQNSGDPTSGSSKTGAAFTTLDTVSGFFVAYACGAQSATGTFNFGQRAFSYTSPSGYSAMNTSVLPAPDIADGSDYFQTKLYTGNATARSITIEDNSQNAWQPDLTWIKCRSVGTDNVLTDAVRGATKVIRSNLTNTEYTQSDSLTAFTSTGFNLGDDNDGGVSGNFNVNGRTYVAWNWLAGNGTSTPSGGSIASTVSANPSAGFSIVSYVGTQAAGTIAHGLNVAPSMIICKDRDVADRWPVYHSALGNAKNLRLDNTTAAESDSGIWNSTSPTSTVFSVGTSVRSNRSGSDYIAYCFAEVEGYSKFGSYTGNGSTDGPFVYCGFRPKWILIKDTNQGQEWNIRDTSRNPYNVADLILQPQSSYQEQSGTFSYVDILSNGFKARTTHSATNASGGNYIFAAFAENPFGGSGVSPATAR